VLEQATYPLADASAIWSGAAWCEAQYNNSQPIVPCGLQAVETALGTEQGYKKVRGQLTEGRWLTFEQNGYALSNAGNTNRTNVTNLFVTATKATKSHNKKMQRWVLEVLELGGNEFRIYSAVDERFFGEGLVLVDVLSGAQNFTINDLGNGKGYILAGSNGKYICIDGIGSLTLGGWNVAFRSSASLMLFK
jgi:phospholipase C